MARIQKKTILAIAAASVTLALFAVMAYPAYAAATDYNYALNQENWAVAEETANSLTALLSNGLKVEINAKGYAFTRIDEETIKQYNCTTNIMVQVQPATESTERNVDITGSIKVNDNTYMITEGKVFIGKERKLLFLNCTGTDEDGNQITLKLAARYFWWGERAYALRSKALLQTDEQPMLLLQRGVARINS
jgi:hypothetical protein